MKTCSHCKIEKTFEDFHKSAKNKGGLQAWCRLCSNSKPSSPRTPEFYRKHDLKKKYGITPEDYDSMLAAQSGACAICGESRKDRNLPVDHDHGTGQVRGILCNSCNNGLGRFRDNIVYLKNAIRYLERYETITPTNAATNDIYFNTAA